jgi:hypothetical protein
MDGNGLQTRIHVQDGKRLQTFLAQLEEIPFCVIEFSPKLPLAKNLLNNYDVLVITTRYGEECFYSTEEITGINDFVCQGGGLLLMSNHGDLPGHNTNDMTKQDAVLARQFGIEIKNSWFANSTSGTLSEFSASDLLVTHPIICGGLGEEPIRSIVTNNCCSLISADAVPIISLPSQMIDHRNGVPAHTRNFAVALDAEANSTVDRKGRVVVVADSGFIGTKGTTNPGPGLIEKGDNRRFAQNVIRWLGREIS